MRSYFIILILLIIVNISAQEWTNISPFPASNHSVQGNFISDEKGWIFQSGMYISRDIYYTEDGGDNWGIIYSLEDTLEYFISLQMIDNQHGWGTKRWRNNQYPNNSYYSYVKTTDGGYSWEDMTDYLPELDYIGSFFFINQDIGFIEAGSDPSSYQALIYKSIDGGESWYLINAPLVYYPYPDLVNYSVNKFFFLNENNGWVACSALAGAGISLSTTDGGENWDVGIEPGLSPNLFDIHFTDINSGGVVGHNGSLPYVAFTEDNFETFSYQYNPSNWNQLPKAICFQNDSTVWITGSPGIINRSTNRGETFEIFQIIDAELESIQFFNNTGFIFGRSNSLLKFVEPVSAEKNELPVANYTLTNYPNPFNPSTEIRFQIPDYRQTENVKIEIYNLKGQNLKTFSNLLINQSQNHRIIWDGTDQTGKPVSSSIYYYQLLIDGHAVAQKKCVLIK